MVLICCIESQIEERLGLGVDGYGVCYISSASESLLAGEQKGVSEVSEVRKGER